MQQKQKRNLKIQTTHLVGSIGYLFCFLQWFWAIMLYFSLLQSIPMAPIGTSGRAEQFKGVTLALPGSLETIIIAIVVGVMVLVTIYILVKIPSSIAKAGNVMVHKSAETMTPVIAKVQHRKATKSFRARLTPKLIAVAKLLLVAVPAVLTAASGLLEKQSIDYPVAVIIGGSLAVLSSVSFIFQYALARVFHIKSSALW